MSGFDLTTFTGPEYDFVAGYATGHRMFTMLPFGYLSSVTIAHVWTSGTNTASCHFVSRREVPTYILAGPEAKKRQLESAIELVRDLLPPVGRCKHLSHACGFYAYHNGEQYPDGGDIQGVIRGWGCTTVGTRGFRAEKASIVAVAVPSLTPSQVITAYVIAAVLVINGALMLHNIAGGAWWQLLISLLNATGVGIGLLGLKDSWTTWRKGRARRTAIADRYPDVQIYGSARRMKRDHPADPSLDEAVPA